MRVEEMQRNGFCRGCDRELDKGVDRVIKMYSRRNRGQHILLCKNCIAEAFSLCLKDDLEINYGEDTSIQEED